MRRSVGASAMFTALAVPSIVSCSSADSQIIGALEAGGAGAKAPVVSEAPAAGAGISGFPAGGASGAGAAPSTGGALVGGAHGGVSAAERTEGSEGSTPTGSSTADTTGEAAAAGTGSGPGEDATRGEGETTAQEGMTGAGGMVTEPLETDRSGAGTCARWNTDHADLSEGTWSGSVEACDPGDISDVGRANALRLYNLYRWLAELPAVQTSPERNRMAQACALLMEANGRLSHSPGMDWGCWTEEGAEGAGSSNLSTGSSVAVVGGYMLDPGNETTLGHRRWILSNSLGPIGIGSTGDGASCMQNLGGQGNARKEWVAWPPPGLFPLQAYHGRFGVTLSATGWSVQSDSVDLGNAQVSVTSEGENLTVSVTPLQDGYGSRYAFRFNPEGWEPEADRSYTVTVSGPATPITYEVRFVDCG